MKENYEGMEEIQEDMIPGEELLSVEGAAGTKEGVLSGEIGTEEEVSSDGIGEEEINEILGNDWTVGEALSPDSPDYQILKGKRRKKRGRRGPLREEKAEPDRQEKEEGKEAKAEDIGRTDVSEEPDKVPESGIELRFTKGRSEGRDGSREKGKRVYDRSGMRDFEESFDVGSGWKKKTSWDEKQGKQGEYREQERISQGAYRDPYERGVAREIQAEDLRSVPKDQSRVAYDSRQDRAVRNSKEQRGDDLRQDQAVGDAKAHGRRHDSGQDIERENSGETDGGIKTRRGYEAGYAAERLSNFRSWQSLYELYVFAGRQVVSGAADTVRRQQGTVSEGLKELRENRIVRFAAALGAGYGAASVYKCMRYRDKRIAETAEKVERLRIAPEVLKDREVLKKALREKKVTGISRHDILKYRKVYLERAEVRELLRSDIGVHRGGYSKEDRRFIESADFMAAKNPDRYAGVLSKYFKQNGYAFAEGNRLLNIGYRDLEKIMHHADNYGFHSSMDRKALSQLIGVKKERTFRIRAGRMIPTRAAGFAGMTIVEADPYLREISGRFSRVYTALRLKKEMTARVSRLIGSEVRKSFLKRVGGGIQEHIVSPMIRHVIKPVIRQTGKGVVKSVGAIRNAAKKAKGSVAEMAAATVPGKAYGRGRRVVQSHFRESKRVIHNIGNRIARTSPIRFTKRAGSMAAGGVRAGVSAGRRAAGYTFRAVRGGTNVVSRAGYILGTPFRLLGRVGAFLSQVRLKLLMYAGGIILGILGFLLILFERILAMELIVAILSFDFGGLLNNIGSRVLEVYENYIEYSDYKDMREDLRMLRELSEDTFEEALEVGRGVPKEDEVYAGHRISGYGSPDKVRGYTIHFLDPSGNELASRSNNVRDIEALCAAMIGNQMGEYFSYSRDLAAFDELLKDMYALMVPEFSYEESEIYTCLYGCETFYYHCDDPGDYDRYYALWEEGVGLYEDLVGFDPEGCMWDEESGTGYCMGHSVPVCFGHRDVDIYITLFDAEYAIAHNVYPENWRERPYARMIREFVENGAWDSEFYPELARNFIDPDWHDAYGFDPDGGAGYSTADSLSGEDISRILSECEELSRARQEILSFALESVGRIPYYWGGKADAWGYDGNDFGSPVKADRKGRDKKGLDCSGFVQWVYGSVLGIRIPGSTAGYAGYARESYGELQVGDIGFLHPPGAESNHMGIYAGKDASGNDLWIHCSSTKGSTYGTYSFKYFVNVF